jgi:hypothetical protein
MSIETTELHDLPRVAYVLDPYQVVLNKGSDDGLRLGQSVVIYIIGSDIIDPVTYLSLGPLEIVRGRGKVVHLQPKLATVRSSERMPSSAIARGLISGIASRPAPYEELPFDGVEVGDLVKPI